MSTIYFQGSRADAKAVAARLVRMLTGSEADQKGLAKGVFTTIGVAALSDIKSDFVRKARGGTGEDGNKWQPLSKKYLAYQRRFGRGEKAALKKAAGLTRAHRFAPGNVVPDEPMGASRSLPNRIGLLTAAETKRWWEIYFSIRDRFLLSMPLRAAKARAAAIAWSKIKAEGGHTMLEVYGNRKVEILRDTGVLLNSLSPGQLTNANGSVTYQPPGGDGSTEQVLQAVRNGVIVGTTVKYAAVHQYGHAAKGIPARPFLPTERVPDVWLSRWEEAAAQAIGIAARRLFEDGAS